MLLQFFQFPPPSSPSTPSGNPPIIVHVHGSRILCSSAALRPMLYFTSHGNSVTTCLYFLNPFSFSAHPLSPLPSINYQNVLCSNLCVILKYSIVLYHSPWIFFQILYNVRTTIQKKNQCQYFIINEYVIHSLEVRHEHSRRWDGTVRCLSRLKGSSCKCWLTSNIFHQWSDFPK